MDKLATCKSDGQRIHCVVPMVVSFGPILNFRLSPTVPSFFEIGQSQSVVLIPIQLSHHIDQLPIFPQTGSNGTGSGNHEGHQRLENLPSLLCYVLAVPKLSIDKILRDVLLHCQKSSGLGSGDALACQQAFYPLLIGFKSGFIIFIPYIIGGSLFALFQICLTGFQGLICKRVVK